MRYRSPKEAFVAIVKYSVFKRGLVRHILDRFELTDHERELLIPCFFLMNMRNLDFGNIVASTSFRNLVVNLTDYLGVDSISLE